MPSKSKGWITKSQIKRLKELQDKIYLLKQLQGTIYVDHGIEYDAGEEAAATLIACTKQGLLSNTSANNNFDAIIGHQQLMQLNRTLVLIFIPVFGSLRANLKQQLFRKLLDNTTEMAFALLTLEQEFRDNLSIMPKEQIAQLLIHSQHPLIAAEAICEVHQRGGLKHLHIAHRLVTTLTQKGELPSIWEAVSQPIGKQGKSIDFRRRSIVRELILSVATHANPALAAESMLKLINLITEKHSKTHFKQYINNRVKDLPLESREEAGYQYMAPHTFTEIDAYSQLQFDTLFQSITVRGSTELIDALQKLKDNYTSFLRLPFDNGWDFIADGLMRHTSPLKLAEAFLKLRDSGIFNNYSDAVGLQYFVEHDLMPQKEPMDVVDALIKLAKADFFTVRRSSYDHRLESNSENLFSLERMAKTIAKHSPPLASADALIILRAQRLFDSPELHRAIIMGKKPQKLELLFKDNPYDEPRLSLIEQLKTYISRIESYSSYSQTFTFFAHSRGINREANYKLANQLLSELKYSPDKSIKDIFSDLIEKRKQYIDAKYDRGINSSELNSIIDNARESSTMTGAPRI